MVLRSMIVRFTPRGSPSPASSQDSHGNMMRRHLVARRSQLRALESHQALLAAKRLPQRLKRLFLEGNPLVEWASPQEVLPLLSPLVVTALQPQPPTSQHKLHLEMSIRPQVLHPALLPTNPRS